MSILIPSLKWVIILSSLVYPLFFVEIFNRAIFHIKKKNMINFIDNPNIWIWGVIFAYGLPLSIIYLDSPHLFYIKLPSSFFYIVSIICIPAVMLVEFIVGYCTLYVKRRTLIRPSLSIHSSWRRISFSALILSIFSVFSEEMIFRQIWLYILTNYFDIPWIAAIIVSSLIYGLNHITFGLQAIPQKFAAGLIYGSLYYLSGSSIFVTTITHYFQNVILGLVGRWRI